MIEQLLDDLRIDEGFVPHVYQDHLGYWTLGHGFLVDKRRGGEIPLKIADEWLRYAATERWEQLLDRHPWLADQQEDVQHGLANMAYQLGVNGVCNFKNMLKALKEGKRVTAAEEALDSKWARQTPGRARRVAMRIRGDEGLY